MSADWTEADLPQLNPGRILRMRALLETAFAPTRLEITDDSFQAVVDGRRTRWVILSRGERQAKEAMEEKLGAFVAQNAPLSGGPSCGVEVGCGVTVGTAVLERRDVEMWGRFHERGGVTVG